MKKVTVVFSWRKFWTLLHLEFKYVIFFRIPIPLDPMGFRWSKIAPGRFLASQVSSEPKFSSNFFSRPSNHRSKIFPKLPLVSFLKTSDMLCFFDMSRVSFGKTQLDYIYPRVEWSSKRELSQWKILLVNQIFSCISPRVEYFSKIEDSFGKLHQIC